MCIALEQCFYRCKFKFEHSFIEQDTRCDVMVVFVSKLFIILSLNKNSFTECEYVLKIPKMGPILYNSCRHKHVSNGS